MVMGDIGEPELLISSASNPHDFALRPSDASRLSSADLIFYTSSTLTPWLSKTLQSLAQNTPAVELISTTDTVLLTLRDDHLFSHKEHDEHNKSGENGEHREHREHREHSGQVYDPHAWLDPANAILWLGHIAEQLTRVDSVNATIYQENADLAKHNIQTMMEEIKKELNGLHTVPYIVFHDSYQYFETRFNLQPKASISLGDGTQPGISQIRKLQAVLKSSQARCVFSEPQYSDRLVNTVVSGMDIRTTRLDPLGFNLETGEELYISLIKNLSSSLSDCLSVQ
jgi:zinc transport system substrate-binding protein